MILGNPQHIESRCALVVLNGRITDIYPFPHGVPTDNSQICQSKPSERKRRNDTAGEDVAIRVDHWEKHCRRHRKDDRPEGIDGGGHLRTVRVQDINGICSAGCQCHVSTNAIDEEANKNQYESQPTRYILRDQTGCKGSEGEEETEKACTDPIFWVPISALLFVSDYNFVRYPARERRTNCVPYAERQET